MSRIEHTDQFCVSTTNLLYVVVTSICAEEESYETETTFFATTKLHQKLVLTDKLP